jgi:hypothetical protein
MHPYVIRATQKGLDVFEFVKTLITLVVEGFPKVRATAIERKRRQLGKELFQLYAKLHEIANNGEEIIQWIRVYCIQYERTSNRKEGRTRGMPPLIPMLESQIDRLSEVKSLLEQKSLLLTIIDPGANRKINMVIEAKGSGSPWGEGPPPPTPFSANSPFLQSPPLVELGDVDGLLGGISYSDFQSPDLQLILGPRSADIKGDIDYTKQATLNWKEVLVRNRIPYSDGELYPVFKQYLSERRPIEELRELRAALEELRTALVEHFTLSDILLEFGEPRPNED